MGIVKLFRKYPLIFVLCLFAACTSILPAQDGGVKKSKKTEFVEGKKYYLHTVEKGQTLYAIAKAYELTVNDILVENPDALNGIKPGQVLRIPAEKKTATVTTPVDTAKYITHTVAQGETVYGLCKKYGITEKEFYDINPDVRFGLKVGSQVKFPVKNVAVIVPDTTIIGSTPDSVRSVKKEVYNIAMMLPLQLWNVANIDPDEIVAEPPKAEFPQKPLYAVEFYEGALLAIDSMKRAGMKVNVWVYDIDDLDSGKTASVLAKPELQAMDMIIGPFSPGLFDEIADFANAHHIAIISPVSPANKVLLNNPMAVKTVPSSGTQMEILAAHVAEERKEDNIIMVTSGLLKEQAMSNSFRDEMNRLRTVDAKDSIKVNQGFSGLEAKLAKDKMNVLVVPSMSQAFVTDLLRNLYGLAEKYQITVYGIPVWLTFENLDAEYMEALHLHFAAPYYIDYHSAFVKRFIIDYRAAFGGDPTEYSFAGYDVTMFFLQQLQAQGTGFVPSLITQSSHGLQQDFTFMKSDAESGYENRGVRIVHISDYELVPFGVENPKPPKK